MSKRGVELQLTENARTILEKRYLAKDEDGRTIETPEDLFARVAHDIAKAEKKNVREWEEKFYGLMISRLFTPNSPCLANAGRPLQQLAACFVIPVEDDIEGIFGAVQHQAMVQKTGGGTGFSFSRLRPSGDRVASTTGVASGPVSFMMAFDAATETIKQGGFRRGANMGILRVDHPDIRDFIQLKDPENQILSNFNISVAITDRFMECLKAEKPFELRNPRTEQIANKVNPKEIWDLIVHHAWLTGDPGLWFIDRTNASEASEDMEIESTNPCGEQPLLPYESCVLGSINLERHMNSPGKALEPKKLFNWQQLRETVHLAVRFLDDMITRSRYPVPEIEQVTKRYRRIGLGVMGWADVLAKSLIPYDSNEALELAEEVMSFINSEALDESVELSRERGPFDGVEDTVYKDFDDPPRNIARTTIAPTGTIASIAGCYHGIEPYFALAYERHVLDGETLHEKVQYIEETTGSLSDGEWEQINRNKGSMQKVTSIPARHRAVFKTAMDIGYEWHIKMQASFQKFTDNAVSKTINMPNEATEEEVSNAYMLAWDLGCKGITVYRDGSKVTQVMQVPGKKQPQERPSVLSGNTHKITTGHGSAYITVNERNGKPFEVFARIGKPGACDNVFTEAIGRLISIALRAEVDPKAIVKQLRGIRCGHPSTDGEPILSGPDAIGAALQRSLQLEGETVDYVPIVVGTCHVCEVGTLIFQEGCERCTACDYTRCG